MLARPAGMSDDEYDDEDRFSFSNEDDTPRDHRLVASVAKELRASTEYCDVYAQEGRTSEPSVISASMMGHLEIVEEYLESRDVDEYLYTGWTLLLYAAFFVQPTVVRCLLTYGADPNGHKDGYTPLMAVCDSTKGTTEKSLHCLRLLIEAKADVNASNKQKKTPLMYACTSKDVQVVTKLLEHVRNINVWDCNGKTALMYAVAANKPDVVKLLLDNNADTGARDRYGLNAIDIAATKGFDKILPLLSSGEPITVPPATSNIYSWVDLFPRLHDADNDTVHFDIATILYGMGLDAYWNIFQGTSLDNFLQLTDDDLIDLGMEITVHRQQFMNRLHKFHSKKWNVRSIGAINKSSPYTFYDGIISLANTARQMRIIGSSYRYIKNSLYKARKENVRLAADEKIEYGRVLHETQTTLAVLKRELLRIKSLAKQVHKNGRIGSPAIYVGPKRSKTNWTIVLGITLMAAMFLSKTMSVRNLWMG